METARCRAFLAAAETGSFSRAAEMLRYTPSGVNQLVTALEKEIGFSLFSRSTKGVALTANGQLLLPVIREILHQEDKLFELSAQMNGLLIGTGTSIILDPVFIFVLGWGVKGAAVANVIAQLISSVWIILFLASGRSAIRLRPANIRFNRVIVPILTLGLAPIIMQLTECLINVVFNVGLQRYGGDDYVTSMTIITSLMQVVSVLTNGFLQGIQPIIGFNFGARRMDRVRQAIRVAFIAQITSATVLVSLLAAFPCVVAAWFTSSPEVIGIVTRMMPVFVAGWGVFGIQMGAQCALVGMGQAKQSVFLAIFRKIIMLVPLALTLPHWIGVTGIFLAEPISDATSGIVAGILFYITYRSLTRRRIADDAKNR